MASGPPPPPPLSTGKGKVAPAVKKSWKTEPTKPVLQWKDIYLLHAAACEGRLDDVKQLVEKDPSQISVKDDEDSGYWTPLHYASWYGKLDVVEYLVSKGAEVSAPNAQNSTPLHFAAGCGHLAIVKVLIEKGKADKQAKDKEGRTPLKLTQEIKPSNWADIVQYLS